MVFGVGIALSELIVGMLVKKMSDVQKRAESLRQLRSVQPQFLYKYRAGNPQDLDALQQRKVWISSFSQLNDPHDGDLDIDYCMAVRDHSQFPGIPIRDEWGEIVFLFQPTRVGIGDPLAPPDPNPAVVDKCVAEVERIKFALQGHGVYSLTTNCVNEKMWAYYGGGHQGYCIEYPFLAEIFDAEVGRNPVFRMNYVDAYPRHDLAILRHEPFHIILWKLLQHKSKEYDHEDEWRMFFERADFLVNLNLPISSIVFGLKAPVDLIDKVRGFFVNDPEVKFKRVKKIRGSFGYEIELF